MVTQTKKAGAVVKWDEELARQAQIASKQEESVATGQFFSIRGGQLSFNDSPIPGNAMAVVILDAVLENVYYEGEYDPDTPQSPVCFAFGRDDSEMTPHEIVIKAGNAQSTEGCAGCEHNEWGSAERGRGKACRNTRRLALIPAGNFDDRGRFKLNTDQEHFESTSIAFMKLPVTSVKGYAAFVKQVAGALKRPPFGIVTKVSVVPDAKTQFKVVFEPIQPIPDTLMGAVMARHEEAGQTIDFPYTPPDDEPAAKPARGAKGKAAPARGKAAPAARRGGSKY